MPSLEKKNFGTPDRLIQPEHTFIQQIDLEGMMASRNTFAPGWRWSTDVGPLMKTLTCHVNHYGYVLSGRLRVRHASGEEQEFGPGDLLHIKPDHDGWVVGDEEYVAIEFLPTA